MKKNLVYCLILFFACMAFNGSAAEKEAVPFEVKKGINISHWLSQSGARGERRAAYFTEKDVAFLASLGYDHLRIPIDEEQMFDEEGNKHAEAFLLLHQALDWCRKHQLRAIVDLHILRSHYFDNKVRPLFTDPEAQEKFYACWEKLSGELNKYPNDWVAYELMNEPVADDSEVWNKIVRRCVAILRNLEPERKILIGSNRWQNFSTVKELWIPENDPNIIITFHYYEPFLLTHHRAPWHEVREYTGPVHYPGKVILDEELDALPEALRKKYGVQWNRRVFNADVIEGHFKQVLDVAKKHNLPVYCGEFGCCETSPAPDKYRWYRDVTMLFKRHNIGYSSWDYKGGFGIIRRGEPVWPMIEPLTGKRALGETFSLHPENPKYFLFRGKPTLLVTSGEHYGVLLNGAFNFDKYLETLSKDGLNHTRVFMGSYREEAGNFNIRSNTLAPGKNYVSPWVRSQEAGALDGANKFDLTQFNPAYFERLHQLVQKASELGIVLELTLFCPIYDSSQWKLSPMNAQNNIQGIGKVSSERLLNADTEEGLLRVQKEFVRKVVSEVNGYDNFYFEICNEPYFGGVTDAWQRLVTDWIVEAEKEMLRKHLISVNVANGSGKVENPHESWSLLNFHYCSPPSAVAENAHLPLPVGMNETGFKGVQGDYYRREAWEFMLSGGALYNNLDYSFTVGYEDGTFEVKDPTPGCGSPEFRRQIGLMKRFLESADFIRLKPVQGSSLSADSGLNLFALEQTGKEYLLYSRQMPVSVTLKVPSAPYEVWMLNTITGAEKRLKAESKDGKLELQVPEELRPEVAISLRHSENN